MCTAAESSVPQHRIFRHPASQELHCLPGSGFRCHSVAHKQLVHPALMRFVGSVNVSRRALRDLGWIRWSCDVQACRGDRLAAYAVKWTLPPWMAIFDGKLCFRGLPFYLSIQAPRVVPFSAGVWDAIQYSKLHVPRSLFALGEASVFDVNEAGQGLLQVGQTALDDDTFTAEVSSSTPARFGVKLVMSVRRQCYAFSWTQGLILTS